jgi:hypothetical protein
MMGSRRTFIKKLSGAALGAAAAAPMIGCATRRSATDWAATYDWICVGSGIEGGLEAAIFGHDQGLKTLLLEESELVGGEAPHGLLYVPMNHLMREAGIPDSRDEALSYFRYMGAGYNSPEFIEAFVDNSARGVEHLHRKADVRFRISELIDFWAPFSEGGWRLNESASVGSKQQGRSLTCEPFPAETLGNWRNKVRLSVTYHGLAEVLEGQEHNPGLGRLSRGASWGTSIGHSGPFRGRDTVALSLWRKRLGPKLDELLKKDEEQLVAGPALAGYLLRAALQRGIDVQTDTAVEKLVVEDGRVAGVVVNRQGREESIKANRGVMLATGTGDGWRLAAGAGGAVYSEIRIQGVSGIKVPDEPAGRGNYEVRMRHSMIVNRFGERFADEGPYQAMGSKLLDFDSHGEHRFRNIPNYFVFDHHLIEKYSFAGRPPGATEGLDWVAQGRTLAELAQKLDLPAAKLAATVARFNEHARRGKDLDFHRRPETLGPLEEPPFYGVVADPPDHDPFRASISVVTDPNGQAIHYKTRKPIAGLYACGQLQEDHTLMGVGYQAGLHSASAVAFALLAAEHAASA